MQIKITFEIDKGEKYVFVFYIFPFRGTRFTETETAEINGLRARTGKWQVPRDLGAAAF